MHVLQSRSEAILGAGSRIDLSVARESADAVETAPGTEASLGNGDDLGDRPSDRNSESTVVEHDFGDRDGRLEVKEMIGAEEEMVGPISYLGVAHVWLNHLWIVGVPDDSDPAAEISAFRLQFTAAAISNPIPDTNSM